jgi:TPR repeat protein
MAFQYFQKGAALGNRYSENNLGRMYLLGEGCVKNPEEAFKLFTLSSQQNYARVFYNLGNCYRRGCCVPVNNDLALKYFKKAIDNPAPHIMSFFEIRKLYLERGDFGEAEEISQRLSQILSQTFQNHPQRVAQQILLARCYEEGIGHEKDMQAALNCLKRGADDMADAECAFLLSERYGDPSSTFYDLKLQEKYLFLSAEEGYVPALYAYASLLEGNDHDKEAFRWYLKGAEAFQSKCLEKVGVFYLFGLGGVKSDLSKAREYLEKAEQHGDKSALIYLFALGKNKGETNARNAMALYFSSFNWMGQNQADQYAKIQNDLSSELSPLWSHLAKNAQIALISGMINYVNYKAMEKRGLEMDFSQVSNPLSKAVEIEVSILFYQGFLRYLQKKNIPLDSYAKRKSFFVCGNPQKAIVLADPKNLDLFTLGLFKPLIGQKEIILSRNNPFFEGIMEEGIVVENSGSQIEIVTFDQNFLDYCQETFVQNILKPWRREEIEEYLFSLSDYLDFLRTRYRNKGAHKAILDSFEAEACGNLVLFVQKLLFALVSCFYSVV